MRSELEDGVHRGGEPFTLPGSDFDPSHVRTCAAFMEAQARQELLRLPRPLPDGPLASRLPLPPWCSMLLRGLEKRADAPSDTDLCLERLDWDAVFGALRVAAFLQVDSLTCVLTATVAARIRALSPAAQASLFPPPPGPWTAEDEERLRRSEGWAETEPDLEEELKRRAADAAAAIVRAGTASGAHL
jgi:hypothetical protein